MTVEQEIMRQYLRSMGFSDYGIPIGTDPNSQLNLFQDVINTMSDPTFLYLQNLISGEQMARDIDSLLYDIIQPEEADWKTPIQNAIDSGNDLLAEGMGYIVDGLTAAQVQVKLAEKLSREYEEATGEVGRISDVDKNALDAILEELKDFEKKYREAISIESKLASGEYIEDLDGNIRKPVDQETGRKRLENEGYEGYYANPMNWRAGELDDAQRLLAEASALETDRLNRSKAITKESANVAQSAYKEFLNKTPEGRSVLKPAKDSGININSIAKNILISQIPVIGQLALGKKAVTSIAESWGKGAPGSRDAQGNFVRPWDRQPAAKLGAEKDKAIANQDYWAKMNASYAGRAVQDEKRKELERMSQESQRRSTEARALQTTVLQGGGTRRAISMMDIAPLFAAMAAQSAPKKTTTGKAAPRVLSDQEIETMANMIAGGM